MSESAAETAQETPIAEKAPETPEVDAAAAVAKSLFDGNAEKKAPIAAEAKPEAKTEGKEEKVSEKPIEPAKLELKLPENSILKPADLEKIASIAKERGFTNEQAQALVDAKHEALSDYLQQQQNEIKQKTTVEWVNEARNDKEIGGEQFGKSAELAKRVVERFGTDSFKKALNETGLGNHPELVRIFTRIGKAMDNDQMVLPGTQPSGAKKSMEELLYGGGKN